MKQSHTRLLKQCAYAGGLLLLACALSSCSAISSLLYNIISVPLSLVSSIL